MNSISPTRRDLTCLEALYDAPDEDGFDALSTLQATGLTFSEAQRWLVDARAAGLVAEIEPGNVPMDRPTRQGQAIVDDARRRRTDRSYIRRTAQRRLLTWTDNVERGNVLDFLSSDYAWIDGLTLTLEQAADAARALHDDGLIKAQIMGAAQADVVRVDVMILPRGREVIDEYNGDPETWRARVARRETVVNIGHNTGPVAVGGDGAVVHATLTNGIDADALGRLVEALVAARGALGLAAEDERDFDMHLEELKGGEPGRVQRALHWFGRLGNDIGSNALGGMLAAQAIGLLPA